jgi:hypothetical protein
MEERDEKTVLARFLRNFMHVSIISKSKDSVISLQEYATRVYRYFADKSIKG